MPWTHPDHEASAREALQRGIISGALADLADVPEPQQSSEHQARVSALAILNEVGGADRTVTVPWHPGQYPPVIEPPIDPPVEPPVEPPDGVVVTPADWQSKISGAGQDTVFLLSAGTYNGFGVSPKPGQQFYAVPDASVTLDGGGRGTAFYSSKSGGVVIDGRHASGARFHIKNYRGEFFRGVINNLLAGDWYNDGNDRPDSWLAEGWKVHGVHLTNVGTHGVTLCGNGAELTDFEIIGETGTTLEVCWKMLYGYDQVVADGEASGARPTNWGNEGGGSKNWNTIGLVVERVKSHGHTGPGIWHDFNNFESTVRDCEVWDCSGPGIFQEISVESQRVDGKPAGVSIIENNVVRDMRNSTRWGGVEVATAGPVIVRNNTIRNSKAGIWFRDQGGRAPQTGNTSGEVYGNVLDNAGQSGYIKESGQGGVVTWRDNQYVNGSFGL